MRKPLQVTATGQEHALIMEIMRQGDLAKAAKSLNIPIDKAEALVRKPYMRKIFLENFAQVLITELAPMAVKQLKSMLSGQSKPSAAMTDICKTVLDRVGLGAANMRLPVLEQERPIEDMSIAELQTFIRAKEAALPDVTPHNAPPARAITAQDVEFAMD